MLGTESVVPHDVPVLLVTSQYDFFMLSNSGDAIIDTSKPSAGTSGFLEFISNIERFSGHTLGSYEGASQDRYSMSVFGTSCVVHP